jgi:hypothetical protein
MARSALVREHAAVVLAQAAGDRLPSLWAADLFTVPTERCSRPL